MNPLATINADRAPAVMADMGERASTGATYKRISALVTRVLSDH